VKIKRQLIFIVASVQVFAVISAFLVKIKFRQKSSSYDFANWRTREDNQTIDAGLKRPSLPLPPEAGLIRARTRAPTLKPLYLTPATGLLCLSRGRFNCALCDYHGRRIS
jgi:hypothetical protein